MIAIRAEGIGKRYELGRVVDRHRTLREAITAASAGAARAITAGRRRGAAADAAFWALRDVSFDVRAGEAVGIIGGNGAGKSTLLKLISRITVPTTGRLEIRGRVGSLLEVGTGFHPDLSGRENVYLNGAILGMRKAEIDRKFDEIVAFAEVARFIDTPVKRYSSGMYMRLAFAVAAHLEPEVLLVDEVLAVGDAAFQQKCLGKMDDVARHGRTVLLVSHNMDSVQRLCARSILLERGTVVAAGATRDVVDRYLARSGDGVRAGEWTDLAAARRRGSGEARFARVRHATPADAAGRLHPGAPLEVDVVVDADAPVSAGSFAVSLRTRAGLLLVNADAVATGRVLRLAAGRTTVRVRIAALHLNPGRYVLGLWMSHTAADAGIDHVEAAATIDVEAPDRAGPGITPQDDGVVPCEFTIAVIPDADGGAR